MKFKALSTFTVFHDDAMHVFNVGDKGELPDAVVGQYVSAGLAAALKGKAAKNEPKPDAPPEPDADDDADKDDGSPDAPPAADADAPPA